MGTPTRDLLLCGVILTGVAGAWTLVAADLPRASAPIRIEPPPATNAPELDAAPLRPLDAITPPGEPAPPPAGLSPDELPTRAA